MTVKELIDHLKDYDDNTEVKIQKLDLDLVLRYWAPLEPEDIVPTFDLTEIQLG